MGSHPIHSFVVAVEQAAEEEEEIACMASKNSQRKPAEEGMNWCAAGVVEDTHSKQCVDAVAMRLALAGERRPCSVPSAVVQTILQGSSKQTTIQAVEAEGVEHAVRIPEMGRVARQTVSRVHLPIVSQSPIVQRATLVPDYVQIQMYLHDRVISSSGLSNLCRTATLSLRHQIPRDSLLVRFQIV